MSGCKCGGGCRCKGSFSLFAFRHHDPVDYRRERLTEAQLDGAIRWALAKGSEYVLIQVRDDPPAQKVSGVTQHVCNDPACPGGC